MQQRAEEALRDSILLFNNKSYSNAYYLSGYAVELGLKACIAKNVRAETIPDKSFLDNIYSHRFETLVGLAGLGNELSIAKSGDKLFRIHWGKISHWKPDSRYEMSDLSATSAMLLAIRDEKSGVMQWIRNHW